MKYRTANHDWQNMSDAIACCGGIYLVGAALVMAAAVLFTRRNGARPRTIA